MIIVSKGRRRYLRDMAAPGSQKWTNSRYFAIQFDSAQAARDAMERHQPGWLACLADAGIELFFEDAP